jgi:demethylmenaquinone methyltransferase/2-methoxy-6-polyprenyl-1,4-benzoquinol methylase
MAPSSVERAIAGGEAKRSYVRSMFTAIAPRYDLLNHFLSLNVDRWWRRRTVQRLNWERAPTGRYLDICAGTLDLAAALARRRGFGGSVIGADFVVPMLARGRGKAPKTTAVGADALLLPFPSGAFDGAMVAFGVRNLENLDTGLAEIARVLKPGARLVILEFATPTLRPLRAAYLLYFRRILPAIGRFVSQHTTAYTYLPESVLSFPAPTELADRLERASFDTVGYELLTGGIVAIHWGVRQEAA